MGGTVNAAEASVRNAQGSARDPAAEQQGVPGVRQVSVLSDGMAGPSLRERREAGAVPGDIAGRSSLRSRQATALSPNLPRTDSATWPSPPEQTGEPPAATATEVPTGGVSASCSLADIRARFIDPSDLEPTVLINARGDTLFRGVRHGILDADGLDLPLFKSLPEGLQDRLLKDLHPFLRIIIHESFFWSRLECTSAKLLGTDAETAATHIELLQHGARERMAEGVAAAALATDPEKCKRALNGEIVYLHLCAVSLSRPHELEALQRQASGFQRLTRPTYRSTDPPIALFNHVEPCDRPSHELRLHDQHGLPCTVWANIDVRQFVLSSVGESVQPDKDTLEQLLGPIGRTRPQGEVGKRVDAIDARAPKGLGTPLSRSLQQVRAAPGDGASHADLQQLTNALAANRESIGTGLQSRLRVSRTLAEAGGQLKAIWAERGDLPPGADAHLRAAALTALVAYHMGETPLLISGDKGLTERLDAEVKCLATYADSHDGHLPPFDFRVQD